MLLLLLVVVGDFFPIVNSAKVSVQTTRENPKPLVKKSHVFFRLFEESKMCFKRVDIYIYIRVYNISACKFNNEVCACVLRIAFLLLEKERKKITITK